MNNRTKFQNGTIIERETATGRTFALRYYQDGKKKSLTLGTNHDLPTLADAKRKAAAMLPMINKTIEVRTFGELVERYIQEEIPSRPQTAASYLSNISHLRAKFEGMELTAMLKNLMEIQTWLRDLKTFNGKPMSKKTKQNIKACLHRIIECGMRWGYLPIDRNPVGLVEIKVSGIQPKKRLKQPLTRDQITTLLHDPKLAAHVKTMIVVSVLTGMRISEVLGLKWSDINFATMTINIERSIVGMHVDATKSEGSSALVALPLPAALYLNAFKDANSDLIGKFEWIFANVTTGKPFHRDSLQSDHLKPAGIRAGISDLGWHTFRHTYAHFQRLAGIAPEVQMMSMRHADMATTNAYGRDAGSLALTRPANEAVVSLMFPTFDKPKS